MYFEVWLSEEGCAQLVCTDGAPHDEIKDDDGKPMVIARTFEAANEEEAGEIFDAYLSDNDGVI